MKTVSAISVTPSHRAFDRMFGLLLCAFVALAVGYSLVIPLGEAPDEVSHITYVEYLLNHRRLPTFEASGSGQADQPPLYYLLGAAMTSWIPDRQILYIANPDWKVGSDQMPNLLLHTRQEEFPYRGGALAWHVVRLLSVLCGAATVWATHRLGHKVFPGDYAVAFAAACFVAFLPQFTFIRGVANNDALVIMLSALALLSFLNTRRDLSLLKMIGLGTLLGLAALTKISAFALWGAIGVVMLFARGEELQRDRIRRFGFTFGSAVLVIIPWLVFTILVLEDPFNWVRFRAVTPRIETMIVNDWGVFFVRVYQSFWGAFGGITNLKMPGAAYIALTSIPFAGLVGLMLLIKDWRAGLLAATTRHALVTF